MDKVIRSATLRWSEDFVPVGQRLPRIVAVYQVSQKVDFAKMKNGVQLSETARSMCVARDPGNLVVSG